MNTFDWKEKYEYLVLPARDAIKKIRPGDNIFIGTGCAQPQHLVNSLVDFGNHIYDAHIIQLLTMGAAPYVNPKFREKFKMNSFFIAENVSSLATADVNQFDQIMGVDKFSGRDKSGKLFHPKPKLL